MIANLPLIPLPQRIEGRLGVGSSLGRYPIHTMIDPRRDDLGVEGYELLLKPESCVATAATFAGMRYALETGERLRRFAPDGTVRVVDVPRIPTRGVMIDMARCTERHSYYYELVDLLASWKFNTLFLHIADNEGCALRYDTVLDSAGPHAFTKQGMAAFVQYASDQGLTVVPEIETFGHAGYILRLPAFAHLAEDERATTLCTTEPATWELLDRLIAETADLFPHGTLHLGCDEARFGCCTSCRTSADELGEDGLLALHLTRVCDLARAHHRRPMIWADLLRRHPSVINELRKDTILCHWDYGPDVDVEPAEQFLDAGFDVVTCPAVLQGSRLILPRTDSFANLEASAANALSGRKPALETTIWNPERVIPDTILLPLAYAGELSWSGQARSRSEFASAFASSFFGVDEEHRADVGRLLLETHSLSELNYRHLRRPPRALEELDERQLEVWPIEAAERAATARRVAKSLEQSACHVSTRHHCFGAYQLAASVSLLIQDRMVSLLAIHDACMRSVRDVDALPELVAERRTVGLRILGELIERHCRVLRNLDFQWSLRRYSDDPTKREARESLIRLLDESVALLRSVESEVRCTPDRLPAWSAVVDAAEKSCEGGER